MPQLLAPAEQRVANPGVHHDEAGGSARCGLAAVSVLRVPRLIPAIEDRCRRIGSRRKLLLLRSTQAESPRSEDAAAD